MSEQKKPVSEAPAKETNINKGRRRLSKAAMAAPVIASLAARPALGAGCSISGFMSGNTSPGHGDYTCSGFGCTPGFWKNNVAAWYRTGYNPGTCATKQGSNCKQWSCDGTLLLQILPTTCSGPFFSYPVSSGDSLMLILVKGISSKGAFNQGYAQALHYIAAILNAASDPNAYGATVEEVQAGLCKAAGEGVINWYTTVLLAGLNERGCMYNAHGDCAQNFTADPVSGVCIPACPPGQSWDPNTMSCK